MRAIVSKVHGIDWGVPVVSEEFIEIDSFKDYYKHLECDMFTVVSTYYKGHELSIFVDDEGLLKPNFGRTVKHYPEPLFGNMVICGGVDEEGDTLPIPNDILITDMEDLISEVKFITRG